MEKCERCGTPTENPQQFLDRRWCLPCVRAVVGPAPRCAHCRDAFSHTEDMRVIGRKLWCSTCAYFEVTGDE
jgi:hypothetical protein